jgi:hypothetical protein
MVRTTVLVNRLIHKFHDFYPARMSVENFGVVVGKNLVLLTSREM